MVHLPEHPDPASTSGPERSTLAALLAASRALTDDVDPADACQLVSEHASALLGAEGASVLLHDPASNDLVFHAAVSSAADSGLRGHRFPADKGIAGQVLRTGRAVSLEDVRRNRHFYRGIDELTRSRTQNLMAAPLVHGGSVFGVVEVVNRRSALGPDALELLALLANMAAAAARRAGAAAPQDGSRSHGADVAVELPVGNTPSFSRALDLCRRVAPTATSVLLQGETGTGKELAARAIWSWSPRSERPFVAVNCAAMPDALVESELFGHEAGAFTGATSARPGRFALADGGTLMLDEVGELPLDAQSKLLRVLESGEFVPVGAAAPVRCDVRVIAATNRDLQAEVDAGRFRADLFYRLNVFPITLPPLRDRLDDLPLLIRHVIDRLAIPQDGDRPRVTRAALGAMQRYRWPGNVRELRNVIERAALLLDPGSTGGEIDVAHLPEAMTAMRSRVGASPVAAPAPDAPAPADPLAEQERRLVLEALERSGWNVSAAARDLGVTRDVMRTRVRRYDLVRPGA